MKKKSKELRDYIEKNIFPIYQKNDKAHDINHISYVIRRSFIFAHQLDDIDDDMVYTIAAFHDIGHHINKKDHELLSAHIFYENEEMKKFFTEEQRIIMKEAIEDHRASLEHEPRSIYGKIVSSADRTVDLNMILQRTHAFSLKHESNLSDEEMAKRAYFYIQKKYGVGGYAKIYFYDEEYIQFQNDLHESLNDMEQFIKRYSEVNHIMKTKNKVRSQ